MIIFLIKFNHLFFYVRSCCDVGSFYYVVHISIISMVKSNIYEARCTLFESFLLDLVGILYMSISFRHIRLTNFL